MRAYEVVGDHLDLEGFDHIRNQISKQVQRLNTAIDFAEKNQRSNDEIPAPPSPTYIQPIFDEDIVVVEGLDEIMNTPNEDNNIEENNNNNNEENKDN